MPSKCFVPGCKTGYLTRQKENEKAGIRNPSVFSAPKDDQLLDKWKQMIPRQDRTLTSNDKVCELHFEEECIEKDYVTLMPDGSLHKIPRGSYTLKKGSIPTIFPNIPPYLAFKMSLRKASTSNACTSENEHKKFNYLENIKIEIAPQLDDNKDIPSENKHRKFNDLENMKINIPPQLDDNIDIPVTHTPLKFDDFFKFSIEVIKVLMPNSRWSIVSMQDCVIFAKWNSKYYAERRVVICKDLSTKIFLMNVEIIMPIEGCTVENVSQLLKKVDDLAICRNADLRTSSGCLGFLFNKRQVFCSTCNESKNNEKDVQRRRNKHILVSKKRKIINEVKSIKQRNTRLKKKMAAL